MNRSLAMYYSNLGTIYATKDMIDEAEAEFKRALDVHAHDVLALFNLGRVLCGQEEVHGVQELLRAACRDYAGRSDGMVQSRRCLCGTR